MTELGAKVPRAVTALTEGQKRALLKTLIGAKPAVPQLDILKKILEKIYLFPRRQASEAVTTVLCAICMRR